MNRVAAGLLLAVAAILILFGACNAAPEEQGQKPGDELMVCCCLGDYNAAEEYARRVQEAVPGSAVRIGARKIKDGNERMVFEVYASHPDMTPDSLGEKLAEFNCPSVRDD